MDNWCYIYKKHTYIVQALQYSWVANCTKSVGLSAWRSKSTLVGLLLILWLIYVHWAHFLLSGNLWQPIKQLLLQFYLQLDKKKKLQIGCYGYCQNADMPVVYKWGPKLVTVSWYNCHHAACSQPPVLLHAIICCLCTCFTVFFSRSFWNVCTLPHIQH